MAYTLFKNFRHTVLLVAFFIWAMLPAMGQVPTPFTNNRIHTVDFGGNTPSNSASTDWWIMPGTNDEPASGYVSPEFPYAKQKNGEKPEGYAQDKLEFNNIRYAITKRSKPLMDWRPATGDHTSPDDDTQGYFALFENHNNNTNDRIFYEETLSGLKSGQELLFSTWAKSLWNTTNFILKATDATTTLFQKEFSVPEDNNWTQCSYLFTLLNDGDVTLTIVVKASEGANAAGLDDITVDLTPIKITAPSNAVIGTNITLEASYYNINMGTNLKYRWEKRLANSDTWIPIPGAEGTETAHDFSTNLITTENTETIAYYRLLVSSDNFASAIYSEEVEIYYSPYTYLFREDFGGNTSSTGASGDWWIMPGSDIKLADGGYIAPDFSYASKNNDYLAVYGQNKLDFNSERYAITKLNRPLMGWLPIFTDDHTLPGDTTKGYFAIFENHNSSTNRVFYETTISNLTAGQELLFNTWAQSLWGGTTNFILKAVDKTNSEILFEEEFPVPENGNWNQLSQLFTVKNNGAVTLSIIVKAHSGVNTAALDDISVTLFEPMAYISSPLSGAVYCEEDPINLTADYRINNTSSIYRWQIEKGSGWETLDGATGTLDQQTGQIYYSIPSSASAAHSGFYRLQITKEFDPGYTDSGVITSSNVGDVQITVDTPADISLITNISQNSFYPGQITLTATVDPATPANYTIRWYFENNSYDSDSENKVEFNLNKPGRYPMQISFEYPGYCEIRKDISVNVADTLPGELSFEGCGEGASFVPTHENTYTIPGYQYATMIDDNGTNVPSVEPGQFIITKVAQPHYWDYENGGKQEFGPISDHTGCDGYFLQARVNDDILSSPMEFYRNMVDVCGGAKMAFTAWLANIGFSPAQFEFRVIFNTGEEVTSHITPVMERLYPPVWQQHGFEFIVPANATQAYIAILTTGDVWTTNTGCVALDDVEIKRINPVTILSPTQSEIIMVPGSTLNLEGDFSNYCGNPSTITYQWQRRASGTATWDDAGNQLTYTDIIPDTYDALFYQLKVVADSETYYSDPVKVIIVNIKPKTFWVCPDDMTDNEAGEDDVNYRPSLIRMEVPEIYGIIKWYEQKEGGEPLDDLDEYEDINIGGKVDLKLVSDGKSNTLSVFNERNDEGLFKNRTYWIEVCDLAGNPISEMARVSFDLRQSFICASLNIVVSPYTDNKLHREDFGGTETDPEDPKIGTTPIKGSIVDFEMHTADDDKLPEGGYMLTKTPPTLAGGWYNTIADHTYPEDPVHGYLMAVNATEKRGRFYTYQISNLGTCRNLELLFTGWFASPLKYHGGNKANLKFVLTDTDTDEVLAEFLSGNLIDADSAKWRQYGFKFFVPEAVQNITLEIINNNFRTVDGNDVLIDDIEIYLLMSPVTIVPSTDQFVCPEQNDGNGSITLYGSYEDDGTLGKDLEYQWEFKKIEFINGVETPVSDWQILSEGKGETDNGLFTGENTGYEIDPFAMEHNGYYRLVIGRKGFSEGGSVLNYDCLAISDSCKLILSTTAAPYPTPSLKLNETAFCYDDDGDGVDNEYTFFNRDPAENRENYASFIWKVDTTEVKVNVDAEKLTLKLTDYKPGHHSISLTAFNSVGCANTVTHNFILFPRITTWQGEGDPHNWNDRANWDNGVPGSCTDVIIPHKSMNITNGVTLLDQYPLLTPPTVNTLKEGDYLNEGGNETEALAAYTSNQYYLGLLQKGTQDVRPACDSIAFLMGGSVARTDYLKYRIASVDLDISPGRWYTLSAPLRSMYSGDYFVTGNVKRQDPIVYMMKYNATNPQTGDTPAILANEFTNPFNSLTEALYPGLGYAVRVKDKEGALPALQPFRFPKYEEEYDMWNYNGIYIRTETLPKRTNIGRFTYESRQRPDGSTNPTYPTPLGITNDHFTVTVEEDKAGYSTMLVGNPFMAYLNFKKFAEANSTKLDGTGYYLWNSSSYDAYDSDDNDYEDDPNAIAPMQAFVVQKKGAAAYTSLDFSFDMAITGSSSIKLRSLTRSLAATASGPASLRLDVLRDDKVDSRIRLRYLPGADNSYDSAKDMWTLFSLDVTEPAVLYALLDGKAASIRTLGNLSKPVELGIRTDHEGPLTFRLSGMESLSAGYDIYLEDRLTGELYDLRTHPEYAFTHTTATMQSRFFLRIGNGTEPEEESLSSGLSDIRVFSKDRQITISASTDDPIETVRVYSLQGSMLHTEQLTGKSYISLNLSVPAQVVIVEVTTGQQQKRVKVPVYN